MLSPPPGRVRHDDLSACLTSFCLNSKGSDSSPNRLGLTRPGLRCPGSSSSGAWHSLRSQDAARDKHAAPLCVGLLISVALQRKEIFASLLNKPQFHAITADILFILILVELFRLLSIDLQSSGCRSGFPWRSPTF